MLTIRISGRPCHRGRRRGETAGGPSGGEGGAGGVGEVGEVAVAEIAIEERPLAVGLADGGAVDLGVDVAVGNDKVGPAVLVGVAEYEAPTQEQVDTETGGEGDILEEVAIFVAVEGRAVAGEVGLGDVEDSHAGVEASVDVVGDSGGGAALLECAIAAVAVEEAGSLVARDTDVGPAVVVEVGGDYAEAETPAGGENAGFFGDIGERAVVVVAVEDIAGHWESARAAGDGHALPFAMLAAAGLRDLGEVEVHVVGDE
jgi:hypothetical protein